MADRSEKEVRDYLARCAGVKEIHPDALRAAVLLEQWTGLHHLPTKSLKRIDWADSHAWEVLLHPCASLATFDGDELTRLVLLAHKLCLRVEVAPRMNRLVVCIHPRKPAGAFYERHPGVDALRARCEGLGGDRG